MRIFLTFLTMTLLLAMMPGASYAQNPAGGLAVVDVQKLMSESKAAQSIQNQIKTYREKFLGEMSKKEQTLREAEKSLVEQRASLSAEAFAEKKKAFEKQLLDAREYAQKKKRGLDGAATQALQKLEGELVKVVKAIANEKNLQMVISKQSVVLGDNGLDLTSDAMKRLNAAVSDIKLEVKDK
ncbi:MAG: OmpH family outer membrane protein [Alphaproteobacteria bacterium]|nr:OmpH family outer membrane protein [Alphaproteobacteria bacterium]